jgi:methionyl-tRNA formyltransferase
MLTGPVLMTATPLRIIFAGSGAFGSPTLSALVDAGHKIVHVYTQPDRPAGRGKKLTPTPIAQLATDLKLPLTPTADINRETLPVADVMVVIAFGQKIGEPAVDHPRLGSVNLHASLLPKYRGAAPINWAIINGEKITGNSIIRLASKMDAGAILAQSRVEIGETETAGDLHDRLALDGAHLVMRVLNKLSAGEAIERDQVDSMATIAPKLSRETAVIDWSQSANTIARKINGLSPWPGCRVRLTDGNGQELSRMTLLRAKSIGGVNSTPGTLHDDGSIGTGAGQMQILDIQPEGKKPMPLADYRRGHRWTGGMRLLSP